MSKKERPPRPLTTFEKQIEVMIPAYVAATGDKNWTRDKVAMWAIDNDLYEQRKSNAVKELSKLIGRVAQQAGIPDGKGHRIRKYLAYPAGDNQPMLWAALEDITPENAKASVQQCRDKLVNGALKMIYTCDYYNEKHNPGDPLVFDADLTKDIEEKRQSGLYDDVPPEDDMLLS